MGGNLRIGIRSLVNARGLLLEFVRKGLRYCSYLFLCMLVRQWYGGRRRGLGQELFR